MPDRTPLYGGSAAYYATGRLPYAGDLAGMLGSRLGGRAGSRLLDSPGSRLLDVGCGPGTLSLLLADWFEQVVGVDADPAMVAEAERRARAAGRRQVSFRHLRAEELSADLGSFTAATFGQSFHWVDQDLVARRLRRILTPGALCALVYAWSLRGDRVDGSPHPVPPYDAVEGLLDQHLGPDRVGLPQVDPDDHGAMVRAGFIGPEILSAAGGEVVTSSVDDLVARCLSTSAAAPARLGAALPGFVADLRNLLRAATPTGAFDERVRDALVHLWRQPGH